MGNHARRRAVAAKLRAAKLPTKLYRGPKLAAYRLFSSHDGSGGGSLLQQLDHKLDFVTPGQLVFDCYGSNFHVKCLHGSTVAWYRKRRVKVAEVSQLEFIEGVWSCGCGTSPEPPQSRATIEATLLTSLPDQIVRTREPTARARRERALAALQRGDHVLDEEGVFLPEFAWYRGG